MYCWFYCIRPIHCLHKNDLHKHNLEGHHRNDCWKYDQIIFTLLLNWSDLFIQLIDCFWIDLLLKPLNIMVCIIFCNKWFHFESTCCFIRMINANRYGWEWVILIQSDGINFDENGTLEVIIQCIHRDHTHCDERCNQNTNPKYTKISKSIKVSSYIDDKNI